jgi:hypothetical protein
MIDTFSALKHLLGSKDREFLEDHWLNQKPMHIESTDNNLKSVIDRDSLNSIDSMCEAHTNGLVQALSNNQDESVNQLPINCVKEKLATGHSIIFTDFQHSDGALQAYLDGLTAELGFPQELGLLTLYVTPANVGLKRHLDTKDNWVVGVRGIKTFLLTPNTDLIHPVHKQAADKPLHHKNKLAFGNTEISTAEPMEVTLKPGDVLYIPRGYWHELKGNPQTPLSWSLSFALERPTWLDALLRTLMVQLIKAPDWRAPIPSLYKNLDGANPESISKVLSKFSKALPKSDEPLSTENLRAICLHNLTLPQSRASSRDHVYRKSKPFNIKKEGSCCEAIFDNLDGTHENLDIAKQETSIFEILSQHDGSFAIADIAQRAGTSVSLTRETISKLEQLDLIQQIL